MRSPFFKLVVKPSLYVLALGVVYGPASPLGAAPRIVIENPVWNFGCVTNVNHVKHDFVVRNAGDVKLEINRVVTSCDSCLKVYLDESVIAPGARTTAHCVLDTRQLSGDILRHVMLESNDPVCSAGAIELRASIAQVYAVSPLELTLGGGVDQWKSSAAIIPLVPLREPLSEVDCDTANICVDVVEGPQGRFHVVAQASKNLPRGRSVFEVVVRSQNSNDPPCRIVGRLDFPQDYEVIPAQLSFEAKDEFQTRTVWLRQHGEVAMVLVDAVPSSGEFHCVIDPDPASANCRIYVDAKNLAAAKGQTRRVTLKGVTPQNQEVNVPVEITIN